MNDLPKSYQMNERSTTSFQTNGQWTMNFSKSSIRSYLPRSMNFYSYAYYYYYSNGYPMSNVIQKTMTYVSRCLTNLC